MVEIFIYIYFFRKANLPEHVYKIINKDLEKLKRLSPYSPDNSVLRNYLEFVVDLPWSISSKETLDVKAAKVVCMNHMFIFIYFYYFSKYYCLFITMTFEFISNWMLNIMAWKN